MAKSGDVLKYEQWQRRLERFEAAGQTVAQFCREEGVGTHSFYYWRKRLDRKSGPSGRARSDAQDNGRKPRPAAERAGEQAQAKPNATSVIHITWNARLSFSIPASCLGALRCVLEAAGPAEPTDLQSRSAEAPRFAQVIVS